MKRRHFVRAAVAAALATSLCDAWATQGVLVSGGSVDDFAKFEQEDMAKAQKIVTEGRGRAE